MKKEFTVDYIDFHIPKLSPNKLLEIALYLLDLGFNSKEKKATAEIVDLFYNTLNNYEVLFVQKIYNPKQKSFWDGCIISFSGKNASSLYSIIRKNQLDWEIFGSKDMNLGRFDINYVYYDKDYFSYSTAREFLRRSQQFIGDLPRKRWTRLEEDPKKNDLLLKICRRGNPHHQRIYFQPQGLKFELELRKYKVQQFQDWLFENRIQEFEHQITEHFFKRWSQLLPIREASPYTNWILDFHRKNNTPKFNTRALVTNYLNLEKLSSNNYNNAQDFYTLLQFFSYLKIKNFKILDSIILKFSNDHTIFYKIEFHLQDFLRFIEQESYYQLKNKQQILDSFFKNLSDAKFKTFMSSYQDEQFKSLAIFPGYQITKKDKYITVQLYIAKDFYHYNYPFYFNQFFLTYRNQYECIVKLRIIQSFSQPSLIKEFNLNHLVHQYKRSPSQVRQIKQIVLESFNRMKQIQIIESKIMVVIKDHLKYYHVNKQFTLDMFLKADTIIFTERLVY